MDRRTTFVGGTSGPWRVIKMEAVAGPPLDPVERIAVVQGSLASLPKGGRWLLRGVTSNERYTERRERQMLEARQEALGRPEATHAALIPVRKTAAWWDLAQDERRRLFEEQSGHITTGLKYLPAVARRLYHSRDLMEPFDFLTWFEYAPNNEASFDELVATLRGTPEWTYVEREIDIRLVRARPGPA